MISPGDKTDASRARTRPTPFRAFELAVLLSGVVVVMVAYEVVAPKLYLIYHYGWARVRGEGLSLVKRNRLGWTHWVISNGDQIHVPEYLDEIFTWGCTAAIMTVTVPILWLLFRKYRRPGAAGAGPDAPYRDPADRGGRRGPPGFPLD